MSVFLVNTHSVRAALLESVEGAQRGRMTPEVLTCAKAFESEPKPEQGFGLILEVLPQIKTFGVPAAPAREKMYAK